jgi:SAM-dependent methyltransferase
MERPMAPDDAAEPGDAAVSADRDAPPARGLETIRRSFDEMADAYAREFGAELDRKPFDRALLETFAAEVGDGRLVLDLGCGAAGHVGRFVADRGPRVTGVDFSAASIDLARRLNPAMAFVVADIRALPLPDASVAGITAFYCLIYGTDDDVVAALAEARRVLQPGGRLLAAVHGGEGTQHFGEFLGIQIDVTLRHTTPDALALLARRAGLAVVEVVARDPYADELPTRRIYLRATA